MLSVPKTSWIAEVVYECPHACESHTSRWWSEKKGGVEKRDNDLTKERRGDVQGKESGKEKCSDTLKIYFYKGREKCYSIFVDISTLPGSAV